MYKIKVAGYTSKGLGNFSREVKVVTNIDGRLLGSQVNKLLPFSVMFSLCQKLQQKASTS